MATLHLTFDDGPDPVWTPRVLEALDDAGVVATFFMVGERVLAEPSAAAAVLEAGHDVQLHCQRHIRHTQLTYDQVAADTEAALAALDSVGVTPSLWRTPWGVRTRATIEVAGQLGLELVGWSIDTHDWRGDSASSMLEAARPQLFFGGSVLMHDAIGPGATRGDCANTVELITDVAKDARLSSLPIAALRPPRLAEAA